MIEIDPAQKQELYAALENDGLSLKRWFLRHVDEYLQDQDSGQLSLGLMVADGDQEGRGYR